MFSSLASMPVTASFTDGIMINAHCLDVLKKIKDKSVSSIIIDPPYGGQTHNQNVWDIAWSSELWQEIVKECFRVLVKGGHMVVFSSGKTFRKIENKIFDAYETLFGEEPSNYPLVWEHSSLDSGRVHSHTPRSQFEFLSVFYRTGEGKEMVNQGTLKKLYALDQHIGRTNVLKYYKDDCRSKSQPTVKNFFEDNPNSWTFDYKPEALMRALIRDFTSPGHTVVDFCMRHGMTAVAAKLESRKFIVVELQKDAYKRAVSRYSELFSVPVPTKDVDSDSEEQVVATDNIPLGASAATSMHKKSKPEVSKFAEFAAEERKHIVAALGVQVDDQYILEEINRRWLAIHGRAPPGSSSVLSPGPSVRANRKRTIVEAAKEGGMIGSVIKPIAIPNTTVMKRTRSNRVMEPEEIPPKRQAVSHEGKILDIGTPKRCTRLLVFKEVVSIDGDQYLVAYPDKIDQLKMMTIKKKDVQDYIGEISAADMESLGQAVMPSRF